MKWGNSELDVDKQIVTNDLDVAAAAAKRDGESQAAIDSWMREQQGIIIEQNTRLEQQLPTSAPSNVSRHTKSGVNLLRGRTGGSSLKIFQATYGADSNQVDVTEKIKTLTENDEAIEVGNELAGTDPAPGVRKHLRIVYEENGQQKVDTAQEGEVIGYFEP